MKPEISKKYFYPKDNSLTPLGVREYCLRKQIEIKSIVVTNIYKDENGTTRIEFKNAKGKPSVYDTYLDKFDIITEMIESYMKENKFQSL